MGYVANKRGLYGGEGRVVVGYWGHIAASREHNLLSLPVYN